jgi:ABC-2 type transport system ATP-binding protein
LLILDEPLTGLDPINANLINDTIRGLHQQGVSIIFSTHRMEQVEEMCEHIVLINQGKNILAGRVDDIRQQFKENLYKIEYDGDLPGDFENNLLSFNLKSLTNRDLVVKSQAGNDANDLLRYLIHNDVQIRSFNEILPTINEIFIRQVEGA